MSGELRDMADPNKDADNFVEIDGAKYKEDPEHEGEALIGDDGELVLFEEKPEETEEEKIAREKKEEKEKKAEEDKEPPRRRSAESHIIERQKRKIKKLKEKKEEGEPEEPEAPEGGEEVTPQGKKAIREEVKKSLGPILDNVRSQSDEQELKDVFAKYPDAKKMEKQIRKYMASETYEKASVEFIYLGLASKQMDLQKKKDKADEDAKADGSGGHGKRKKDLSPIPDVRGMDNKELDALIVKVKRGQFSVE